MLIGNSQELQGYSVRHLSHVTSLHPYHCLEGGTANPHFMKGDPRPRMLREVTKVPWQQGDGRDRSPRSAWLQVLGSFLPTPLLHQKT